MQSNSDWTHIPVRKSLRDELRGISDETEMTYTGVIRKFMATAPDEKITKSDADDILEAFATLVEASEVGVTKEDALDSLHRKLGERMEESR